MKRNKKRKEKPGGTNWCASSFVRSDFSFLILSHFVGEGYLTIFLPFMM